MSKNSRLKADSGPPPNLGTVLDFMRILWAVDHGLNKISKRMGSSLGITGPQRLVIRIVGRFPGINAARLAHIMQLHPSTITCIVKGIERRGLITRTTDERDGRRLNLVLTEEGRRMAHDTPGTIEAAVQKVLSDAPFLEVESARLLLKRLANVLAEEPEAADGYGGIDDETEGERASRLAL